MCSFISCSEVDQNVIKHCVIYFEPLKKCPSWEKKNIYTHTCKTDMEKKKRVRELFFLKVLPGALYATKSILRSNT